MLPRWLLFAISLWGGFQIMVLEICGFRVLQTNLGSSVIVTGTLLTLIMVLLSAGYYTGGVLSSRWRNARGLFMLLLLSAVYAGLFNGALLEPVAALGMALRNALDGSVYLQSILPATLLTLLLYGPPVFVMSMISPYLIRLRTLGAAHGSEGEGADPGRDEAKVADPGIESGFFMSLSTVGSIGGTMLSSYLSVPFFGVTTTALATSAVFFVLCSYGLLRAGPPPSRARLVRSASALGVLGLLVLGLGLRPPQRDPSVIYQQESHYGELQVLREQDDSGRTMLTYHPSRVYMHSLLFPDEPLRDIEGNTYFLPALLRPPKSALVLGSAAGGSLRGLELAFPDAALTGVDLDPKVHEVATRVFGVDPTRSRLVTADARVFLAETEERYDFIIVDLFAGEFIPSHCVSVEFFELVRQRLNPGGSVFVNTNMNDIHYELADGSEPFRAIRHLAATLRAAGFPALYENTFFHALFAFPEAVPPAELRAGLGQRWADAALPAALRAAAGLGLYTTFEVPAAQAERYRPFSDRWTPALLIELKSNPGALYAALEQGAAPLSGAPAAIGEHVLARHLAEIDESGDIGLTEVAELVTALDQVQEPLGPGALDAAARYFQFATEPSESNVEPHSDWARLAQKYALIQQLGHANDYEALLDALEDVRQHLSPS